MKIIFHKMHGIGNDYIYIDGLQRNIDKNDVLEKLLPFCDRRKGIGSDGIIFLMPSEIADGKMEMFNIDGSRGEMCGNGARCCIQLIKHLKNESQMKTSIMTDSQLTLETDVGVVEGQVNQDEVTLKMYKEPKINSESEKIISEGREFVFYRGDIGNPHAVIPCEETETLDVMKYGRPIENNLKLFPQRVNVEFYKEISRGELFMRVWERGSGETHACGTGAAVTAGVYRFLNNNTIDEVKINLLGGSLDFSWKDGDFFMKGEAKYIYKGEIDV